MTSQNDSRAEVLTFAKSPLTWNALPICLNFSWSCDYKEKLRPLIARRTKGTMFWGTGSIGKALPANVKLLGPSCKVDGHDIQNSTLSNRVLLYSHLFTKGHSKGTRARQKTFKVLSLIPHVFTTPENKNNPATFSRKTPRTLPSLLHDIALSCTVDLPLIPFCVWGMAFSSTQVLLTPDNRAQQRDKGMAENQSNSSLSI